MRSEATRLYVRTFSRRIGSSALDSRFVSGKLSAWLIDQPSNASDYRVVNDVYLMSVESHYRFKPYSRSSTYDAEISLH